MSCPNTPQEGRGGRRRRARDLLSLTTSSPTSSRSQPLFSHCQPALFLSLALSLSLSSLYALSFSLSLSLHALSLSLTRYALFSLSLSLSLSDVHHCRSGKTFITFKVMKDFQTFVSALPALPDRQAGGQAGSLAAPHNRQTGKHCLRASCRTQKVLLTRGCHPGRWARRSGRTCSRASATPPTPAHSSRDWYAPSPYIYINILTY